VFRQRGRLPPLSFYGDRASTTRRRWKMGVTTCMSLTWLAPSHGSFMIRQSPGSSAAVGKAARKCLRATARTPVNEVTPGWTGCAWVSSPGHDEIAKVVDRGGSPSGHHRSRIPILDDRGADDPLSLHDHAPLVGRAVDESAPGRTRCAGGSRSPRDHVAPGIEERAGIVVGLGRSCAPSGSDPVR